MTATSDVAPIARLRTGVVADRFESSLLRQTILFVLAIKLSGILLVFDPWGLQVFDLPKSLFSRATATVLAVTIVAALMRFGPAIVPRTSLHLAIGGVLVANVISAGLAAGSSGSVQRHSFADESLERRPIDLVPFAKIDGAHCVAFEA